MVYKHVIGLKTYSFQSNLGGNTDSNHLISGGVGHFPSVSLRRRAGVMGFRAGMLCYLLENRKFTKTVGAFAEWVAEYVFRNQMELWGEQMEQELSGALEVLSGERGSAASLLALLPAEFTTADLIKLRARKGQSVKGSAISMVLNRWRNNRKIEQIGEGKWKKL